MTAQSSHSGVVLDLFAGPGGWDEGVRPLGLRPVGFEWDDAACRTGKAAGHHRVRVDVAAACTEPMRGKVSGLIASPPCQTFSMAGKGKGRDALPELQDAVERVWNGATPAEVCPADLDVKSVLVLEPVRYARDLRPDWIACEQVPAVLPIWRAFAVVLRTHGYSAWCGVLNAADYGVPQTRQRAILIASRVRKVAPPPRTHTRGGEGADLFGDALAPWLSMAQALGWGHSDKPSATLLAGGAATGGAEPFGPRERQALRDVVLRSGQTVAGGPHAERELHEPAVTITSRADLCSWQFVSAGVTGEGRPKDPDIDPADTITGKGTAYWTASQPSPTVVTTRRSAEGGLIGRDLASGAVRVTVQEAAVLQSFPVGYPWQGKKGKQFEQVGNAVPPLLARHVVAAVLGVPVPMTLAGAAE